MRNYKRIITNLPVYNDGSFILYKITHKDGVNPKECLIQVYDDSFFYEELSLSDSIIFENEKRAKKIKLKIRIAQDRDINSQNVVKINDEYYKVFNIFHFKNSDGIPQSDLTLEIYPNPMIGERD